MTDLRDEAALRAMAALISAAPYESVNPPVADEVAWAAYDYADALVIERKRRADKRESDLRASLKHD